MPSLAGKSLGKMTKAVGVVLAVLLGRDHRNLIIELAVLVDGDSTLAVRQSVTMELGRLGLAGQLPQTLAEELLVLDADILITEEKNTALRDCSGVSQFGLRRRIPGASVT